MNMKLMKFFGVALVATVLSIGFMACNSASEADGSVMEEADGSVTVIMKKAGKLKPLLGDRVKTTKSLTVSGPINGTDIRCLRQMLQCTDEEEQKMGVLSMLDLCDASIVKGGSAYYWGPWFNKIHTSEGEIGAWMFSNCEGLEHIVLPGDITVIDIYSFSSCTRLTEIVIPDRVEKICIYAFENCKGLREVTFGSGVKAIGMDAFDNCSGLTHLTIPENVEKIGWNAFEGCTGLKSITLLNPTPPECFADMYGEAWGGLGLGEEDVDSFHWERRVRDCVLYVPRGSKEAYSNDAEWKSFQKIVER